MPAINPRLNVDRDLQNRERSGPGNTAHAGGHVAVISVIAGTGESATARATTTGFFQVGRAMPDPVVRPDPVTPASADRGVLNESASAR